MFFNLTLFIQMLNFFLVYQLLARGLLPLALKLILQREQYLADLLAKQDQKQMALAALAQQRLALAQQAQTLFNPWLEQIQATLIINYPVVSQVVPSALRPNQLADLEAGMQQAIVERLQHV